MQGVPVVGYPVGPAPHVPINPGGYHQAVGMVPLVTTAGPSTLSASGTPAAYAAGSAKPV